MAGQYEIRGDRNVVAGRDIINSIINTGDHAQFFLGDYTRLRDAYIDPGGVFERVDLDHFTGREWLVEEIDTFLSGHDRGYFVLEAEAGLGKSTFLAWLARERGFIHHFCEVRPGQEGVEDSLKNLAAQLALAYELSPYEVGVLPNSAGRPNYLRNLLKEAADKRQKGEKIVLVVDALDEAGKPTGQNVLGLPQVLPEGIFFIVSQRPVPVELHVVESTTPRYPLRLDSEGPKNLEDMRRFLEGTADRPNITQALKKADYTSEQFTTILLEKACGVWIYLHFVVPEIEKGVWSPLQLDALPDGLAQYYARYWRHWRRENADKWYETYLPLLTTLAAARESVTLEQLSSWAGVKMPVERLRPLLSEQWRPFLLKAKQGQQDHYRFYHATLQAFFEGRIDREKLRTTSEGEFIDELSRATREAHRRIANFYLARWGSLERGLPALAKSDPHSVHNGYPYRHLSTHLHQAKEHKDLFSLMDNDAWYASQTDVDHSGATYANDLNQAWSAAEEVDAEEIECGRAAPLLGREVSCALAIASLRTLSHNIPPPLLAALVENNQWPLSHALAAARQYTDPAMQGEALAALIPLLDEPQRGEVVKEALATARNIGKERWRAHVMGALAPYLLYPLKKDVIQEALEAARVIGNPAWRAATLARLVPRLDKPLQDDVLGEVLVTVEEILDLEGKTDALMTLVPLLDEPKRGEVLKEALAGARVRGNENDRVRILAALASHVDRTMKLSLVGEALDAAQVISDKQHRGAAVATLVPRLAEIGYWRESLCTARSLPASSRAEALTMLAPHLDASLRDKVLKEALAAVRVIGDEQDRTDALTRLVPRLAETGYVREALTTQTAIGRTYRQTRTLATLFRPLPVERKDNLDHKLLGGLTLWITKKRYLLRIGLLAALIIVASFISSLPFEYYLFGDIGNDARHVFLMYATIVMGLSGLALIVERIGVDSVEGLAILSVQRVLAGPAWLTVLASLARVSVKVLVMLVSLMLVGVMVMLPFYVMLYSPKDVAAEPEIAAIYAISFALLFPLVVGLMAIVGILRGMTWIVRKTLASDLDRVVVVLGRTRLGRLALSTARAAELVGLAVGLALVLLAPFFGTLLSGFGTLSIFYGLLILAFVGINVSLRVIYWWGRQVWLVFRWSLKPRGLAILTMLVVWGYTSWTWLLLVWGLTGWRWHHYLVVAVSLVLLGWISLTMLLAPTWRDIMRLIAVIGLAIASPWRGDAWPEPTKDNQLRLYSHWQESAHELSSSTRCDLLQALSARWSDLVSLGGVEVLLNTTRAIREVGQRWP